MRNTDEPVLVLKRAVRQIALLVVAPRVLGVPMLTLVMTLGTTARAASIDLAATQQALEGWRLTDVQGELRRSQKDADTQYIAARLALGTYKHEAAQRLATECQKFATSAPAQSRCSEVEGEALALRVALSGDDLGTLGLAGRLKATLQRATRLDGRNARAQQLLARYYRVAPWLLGGSATQADACIARAIRIQPQLADELRGIDAYDARDYARALPLLQRAARAEPLRAAPSYFLALTYEQLNSLAAARTQMADTVERFPEFWEATFRLAVFDVESHPAQAVTLLRNYIARAGNAGQKRLAKSYRHLGRAEESLGHRQLAIEAYRQALKLKPGDNAADKALQRLLVTSAASGSRLDAER